MSHPHGPNFSKTPSCGKYVAIHCPAHPHAWKNGYLYMHRVVMEIKLGRLLTKDEVVHHKDEDGHNNHPDNLELKSDSSIHSREHAQSTPSSWVKLKCPACRKVFEKRKNHTHLVKGGTFTSCSNSCRGTFSRRLQLESPSVELDKRIKSNVIKIFQKLANSE